MKQKTILLLVIHLTFLFPSMGEERLPRTAPLPFWIEASGWDESLGTDQIVVSSLKASGVSDKDIPFYTEKFNTLIDEIKDSTLLMNPELDEYQKGELLLEWIHDNLLTRYSFHQTRMDILLDSGENNCVSSSVLYLLAGRILELDVRAVETSDHVFCVVDTPEGPVDVETTTVYGFNPGTKREFADEFNRTGFTYVPPGNYRNRKSDSDKELVALILQNRMAALQRSGNHLEVLGLAMDRHAFLANDKSREEMNSALKNWASELSGLGKDGEAFFFLAETSGRFNLLEENGTVIYQLAHNFIVPLINRGEHLTAMEFLNVNSRFIPDEKNEDLEKLIKASRLEHTVLTGEYSEGIALLRSAITEDYLTYSRWRELSTYLHQNRAIEIANSEGWWAGLLFVDELPEDERNLSGIRNIRSNFLQNWTAEIHNRFVDLVQSKNYQEAGNVLEEGLEMNPGNSVFIQDLKDLAKLVERQKIDR